jgi:DNA-binding Lrp family transcriptional regulator
MPFDDIDKKILELLQINARLSNKEIAEKIGLSITPTYERIKKLENEGVIEKYSAILNESKTGNELTVFCMINLIDQSRVTFSEVEKILISKPEIASIYSITGSYGYMLKIIVKDIKAFNNFIVNELANIKQISKYESMVALDNIKNTHYLNINN